MRQFFIFLIKLIITIGCLVIISRSTNWDAVIQKSSSLSLPVIITSIGIFLSHVPAVVIRWRYFARELGGQIDFWNATRLVAIGTFLNQAFFGTIAGDAIRIVFLKKRNSSNLCSYGSVLLDRYTAIFTVWLFLMVDLIFADIQFDKNGFAWTGIWTVFLGGTLLLCLPIMPLFSFIIRIKSLFFLRKPFQFLLGLSRAFNSAFIKLANVLTVFLPSFYIVFTSSLVLWIVAGDLDAGLSLNDCLFITPLALIIAAIPITIGGWGLRELSLVSLLSLMSVDANTALLISITFGFLILISSLINGVFLLLTPNVLKESLYGCKKSQPLHRRP